MSNITCFLGKTSDEIRLPPTPLTLNTKPFQDYFSEASGQDIDLLPDDSALHVPVASPKREVQERDLHEAAARLTGNPRKLTAAQIGVDRIAVIFAGSYEPRPEGIYGLMFDRGWVPDADDPTAEYAAVPREGCAVFLDAIGKLRKKKQPAVDDEAVCTAIHELGHVFNLHHHDDEPNFMTSSPAPYPYRSKSLRFLRSDELLLQKCSTSPDVHPGGNFFPEDESPFRLQRLRSGLFLRVDMQPREFWPFEPVELDVTVRVPRGGEPCQTPDAVDPGYPCFRIWIEDPTGERRLYRSPVYYCGGGKPLTIGPGAPFERDITIFGQSGGYTFRMPGRHRLWATFAIEGRGLLKSNVLEVVVRKAAPADPTYRALRECLRHPQHASLLYYRAGNPEGRALKRLAEFCDSFAKLPSAAATHYALGRVLLGAAEKAEKGESVSKAVDPARIRRWRARAAEHFSRALDHRRLSPHRRFVSGCLRERARS